jgi:hypothetical protein
MDKSLEDTFINLKLKILNIMRSGKMFDPGPGISAQKKHFLITNTNQILSRMKKIYFSILFIAVSVFAFSQSQRLVLTEEYSRSSCATCAQQDSTYHALMAANTTKVVSVNYHVTGVGNDPMNAQNPTDASSRVVYYNVGTISNSRVDGDTALVYDATHVNYTGSPYNLTQSDINTEYGVSSPFTMTVSHTMSPDYDSAFVTIVVTASQNFNASGFLKLRLAMVEQKIHYDIAPGGNGQADFYNVMRGMYPTATGTAMTANWTNAQTHTYHVNMALPSYIYDKNQLAFVAWIQDDGNYKVKQAGKDNPVQLTKDAAASAIGGLPSSLCMTTFAPTVTLKNTGSATLTSCTINYQVDALTAQTYSWTGSVTSGNTTVITLPTQTVTAVGTHTFTAWPTLPNGATDYNTMLDTKSATFLIIGAPNAAPLTQDFANVTFPPAGWAIVNANNDARTWVRSTACGGFQASTSCATMSFYNSPIGYVDEMVAQNVDMTATANTMMTFAVAYCPATVQTDTLKILVSTDCGVTWTTVYNKSGSVLQTRTPSFTAFTPSAANQWRLETVDLSPYATSTNLVIKFKGISDFGNNLYVDDINVGVTSIMENMTENDIAVFPNPFDQHTTLEINLSQNAPVSVSVFDVTGNLVEEQNQGELSQGKHDILIDGKNLSDGIYLIRITAGESVVTKRVSISH